MGDLDGWLERAWVGTPLREYEIYRLCARLKLLLAQESNIVEVQNPVTIVGDVHGQLDDVLEMFRVAGAPPDTNFLFVGDYVDRGYHSVETMTLLSCLKLRFPRRVHLLRGNHESRLVCRVYGFYQEVMTKYGSPVVWREFTDMFDFLPVAATIDSSVFVVHGGLSPSVVSLDQIRALMRFQDVPSDGALADLMWSDPETEVDGFALSQRGSGFLFGEAIVKRFCHNNEITHMTRAHQLCMEGYQLLFGGLLSTVWSAPNYCYKCGNMASVLEIDDFGNREFNVYDPAPPDLRLPAPDPKDRNPYFL